MKNVGDVSEEQKKQLGKGGREPREKESGPRTSLWGPSKRKNFICLNKDTKIKINKHTWKIIIQYTFKPTSKNSFSEMLLDDLFIC